MDALAATLAGLLAAALLYATTRLFAGYPPAPPGCRRLARREAAFLDAASMAVFPPGGELASGREAGVAEYVDGYVEALPPRQRVLIRALLLLVEQATLIFPAPGRGGRRRFSSLDPEQRLAALEGWRASRWPPRRLVFLSLRSLLILSYLASPEVLRALRLAPFDIRSPVTEADLLFPRVGDRPETVPYTTADLEEAGGPPLGPDAPVHPAYRGDA